MKGKFMIIAALLGALTFGACVDNNESASVENVRNAKAEELKAQAALANAEAQAKVILANAEAALKASQAAINQAEAAIREAEARLVEAQAEWQEIQNEQERAELEALIAKYEAEIAYYQMLKAQHVATMEKEALVAEKALLEAQQNLLQQERDFAAKLDKWADEDAEELRNLYNAYSNAAGKLNVAVGKVNTQKALIAQAKAGIISAEELAAKNIEEKKLAIAELEAKIATTKEYMAVIEADHADDMLTDEEVAELKHKAQLEYLDLCEAYEVALDNEKAALKAKEEAVKAMNALYTNTAEEDCVWAVMWDSFYAYRDALYTLVADAGLEFYSENSDATGVEESFVYGFYTTDPLTGLNSVFNPVINYSGGLYENGDTDEEMEDEIYDGTYVLTPAEINKENLETLVANAKGKDYTDEEKKAAADAVAAAQKALADAEAAIPTAEKAAADAKTAYEKSETDVAAAQKAWEDYKAAYQAAADVVKANVKALKDAVTAAEKAVDAAEKALADAVKAKNDLKNPTAAQITAADRAITVATKDLELAELDLDAAEIKLAAAEETAEYDIIKAQDALGDPNAILAKRDAAVKARDLAKAAYILAVKALGEAPKYDAAGMWDVKAKYFDGTVTYDSKKGTSKLGSSVANIGTAAAYKAHETYEYVNAKGETKTATSAHYNVIAAKAALAAAEAYKAETEFNHAEFVAAVDAAVAEVETTLVAVEAAVKAFNEAFIVADTAVNEADEAYKATLVASAEAQAAKYAADEAMQQIANFVTSHSSCKVLYNALVAKVKKAEDDIKAANEAIAEIEAQLATDKVDLEDQIAVAEAALAMAELEVEVETIYTETAKAALDAALAEYAQSGETEE